MQFILNSILVESNLFYVFIICVNIIIFVFSWWIVDFLDTSSIEKKKLWEKEKEKIKKKKIFLRFISILMLGAYIITLVTKAELLNDIILSLFIILSGYIVHGWLLRRLLLFYWEEVEVSGTKYVRRDYKINIFTLIINFITFIIVLVSILKVFEIDSLLQSGWIIAWILAFLWFTAPVWAADLVAGISMLHHDQVEIGNVVEIKEAKILARVKNISLSEVKLIDLAFGHQIVFRPSRFRELQVENLSLWVAWKRNRTPQHIDAHISYSETLNDVEKVFFEAWEEMIDNISVESVERKYFLESTIKKVEIIEFGDHAVQYRFHYEIASPFYILKAKRLLNTYLQMKQKKYGIEFSTPQLVNAQLDKFW